MSYTPNKVRKLYYMYHFEYISNNWKLIVQTYIIIQKKTFKPLVLYDSNQTSTQTSSDTNETLLAKHQLIEEHRVKTLNMLELNAQMWEKEGRMEITLSGTRHGQILFQTVFLFQSLPVFH